MTPDIDRVVARIAPDPGPGITPGARELLDEIKAGLVSAPVPARRRRWRFAVPFVAAAAAVTVAVTWVLPQAFGPGSYSYAAALDIRREGGDYVVTVKDLFADPTRYQKQLHDLGLDVTVKVNPATPSMEGVAGAFGGEEAGDRITSIEEPGDCFFATRRCVIGFKIPVDFRGRATIHLNRKARPGETYAALAPIDAPGEPLYCVGYHLKTVDQVRRILSDRGVTEIRFAGTAGMTDSVPGSWFVHEGVLSASDRAILLVGPHKKRPGAPGPVLGHGFCAKGY